MNNKTYLSKVVEDENGDLVMLFPEELLKAMKLVTNEVLHWDIRDDGVFIVNRTKIINNTSE